MIATNLELNKVYQMDCIDGLKKISDKSIDHIFTDPPYNVSKASWDTGVLDLLDQAAQECARVLKDNGLMFWFVPTRYLMKIGFLISQYIPYRWMFIWNTPNKMGVGDLGFSKYTAILVFSRSKSIHNNMVDLKSITWKSTDEINTIGHVTPKPKPLLQYLIKNVTKENDIVLDPFLGSGTTAIVCKELNRKYIGFEINPQSVDTCIERLSQETLSPFIQKTALECCV